MSTKRHKPGEIVMKFRPIEVLRGQGMAVADDVERRDATDVEMGSRSQHARKHRENRERRHDRPHIAPIAIEQQREGADDAEQIGADPASFDLYAGRGETGSNHVAHLLSYLGMRNATAQDRRVALVSAIETAFTTDKGLPIANAIVANFRERQVLLPVANMIERMGLAARAIARRRAETALISDLPTEKLAILDGLLTVDPAIGQTRFHWLKSAPDAPGAMNLVGLTERITFLRTLGIDSRLQARIPSGRWDQMIREGDATPAWLANDFNAGRRRAMIVAQVIKLGQKLTDDAVMMFMKLIGRLFFPSQQP